MATSNAEHFPNNGNGRVATAGCECLLVTDLLSGDVIASELHNARDSDQALAHEVLDYCRRGDLIVRDMGFFNLEVLQQISAREAHWISRLPASVALTTRDGTELRDLLKNTRGNRIDIAVWIGRDERRKIPCRLVATRLDKADADKHRRMRRRESKKRGATPSREGLLRDGWRLLVTNMPAKAIGAKKLNDIYSLRWSIEIGFRALKQSCQISRALTHKSDFFHLEALVLAAMIYQILTLKLHGKLCRKHGAGGWLSIEKLSDFFSMHLLSLAGNDVTPAFDPDLRHLRYERRRRTNHWQAIIHCLG
jgi:transposase